ncbi:MAG: PD-(D/E)XK nuclease family protein [Verrucomicrobiales bacterium]|nr:PD-(D/E)XK nuclease family protein [Verrucomicrobiales bacterium]
MQARFLLGPAGSGKTFRCLAEIRTALAAAPEGPPLILLAPKQATFQLERQLLADDSLHGYTRLQIFSFERLAQFILDELGIAPPKFLSDEGRVMVLRALLLRHADDLKLFRASARRPGFAQELGRLLNELQQHQLTPAKLRALAQRDDLHRELRAKLHDLALLSEKYADWLREHELQDGNHLLDFATDALRQKTLNPQLSTLNFSGLWLDGFAEMTPQELDLLAAVIPACERATLAFCLDESIAETGENSWLSIWSAVGKTFQQCRQRIENLPDCEISIETLKREPGKNRFGKCPALLHLEKNWSQRLSSAESAIRNPQSAVSLVVCPNAGAEAAFAAREILKFTRKGGRFRDCAVLVRNLDAYHKPLERAFHRHGIPFFLDRRESVAHHPLAELTRGALRTVAFDWQQDDWFAALKSGFAPVDERAIDDLENKALEFGWRGKKWREPLPDETCEHLRKIICPPFGKFAAQLAGTNSKPNGGQLAEAVRELWSDLRVEQTLERWTLDEEKSAVRNPQSAIHQTVWDQMNLWLENLGLAFSNEQLPLRDWLPVLEAGLANLTVGVVPPALDQVLIGAIDRARNPDLKLALVLGVNEAIFPAAPAAQTILTDADRDDLTVPLGPDLRERLARERYYGYIACTRASEKLAVTFSRHDADGKALNPSPFIAHIKQIFPGLEEENFKNEIGLGDAEHASEIIVPLLEIRSSGRDPAHSEDQGRLTSAATDEWQELLELPALKTLAEILTALREPDESENLSPALAEKLYGPVLRSSVSRLEEFAECPFKFFVRVGLRAGERKVFELDARERGNFQHDVLKIFHEQLMAEGKRWRDIEPVEARERIGKIAAAQTEHFRDGLFRDSAATVFAARALAESLQDFVAVIVTWMRTQYEFDPAAAELGFGGKDDRAPAWEMDLGGGHKLALQGRIDRVDLWRDPDGDAALAVVTDYKSGGNKLDKILVEHGVQLQLLAYLGALRHWKNPREISGRDKIIPAGAFYVNLRGEYKGGDSREEILADADESRRQAYRHSGRFDAGVLGKLDSARAKDQFKYQLKNNGELYANSTEAMPRAEFEKLLDGVETQLRELGEKIFSGSSQVDPYRKGRQTPCEFCDYQAACRIDKWTHQYRVLRAAAK